MATKIVLAYSGGLDTSVILAWLKTKYDAEVITFTADIGQAEELDGLEQKALRTGASKVYIENLQETFARDYIFPMFQASALYEGQYLLGTSIARPLIAKRMVEIAQEEGAVAIAHGATGKGNDQVRFELTAAAVGGTLDVIAPWRDASFRAQFPGRAQMIAYAEQHGIPITASAAKPYSTDRNVLHISFESGMLEDPDFDASAHDVRSMYVLSVDPQHAPDEPEIVHLDFVRGCCVAIDGQEMSPLGIMQTLNALGGKHGIGRIDMVENRFVGMKSRGVYETPGGTILYKAHRIIESLTMDREVMLLRDGLIPKYASLVYNGFWFSPEREAIQALVDASQRHVQGTVRLKLYKGNVINAGCTSDVSLYQPHIATMEEDVTQSYNQDDATGFIRLHALRLRTFHAVQGVRRI
jgi:argininosuccinate synthase